MRKAMVVVAAVFFSLSGAVAWGAVEDVPAGQANAEEKDSRKIQLAKTAGETTPAPAAEKKGWWDDVKVSGFVDLYYEYNFNRPPGASRVRNAPGARPKFTDPVGVENVLRNFDFKHSELALNLAEIVIEKPANSIGFRLDLNAGRTTDWVHNLDPGGRDWRFVQQAFLTIPTKSKYGDKIDFGKFVTHHGAEVIESKDNYNYTRSFLFAWAIPYYHAGIRYWHYMNKDQTDFICFHLYNGWNNAAENNNDKSFGVMYGFKPSAKTTVVENVTIGKEPVDNAFVPTVNGNRFLSDTMITYAASDQTTYVLNVDYGRQSNTGGTLGVSSAKWYGAAGYVKHAVNDKRAWVVRVEWYRDKNGFTTGVSQTLREATFTYEIKQNPHLLWRIEARYDKSNAPVFFNRGGTTKASQTTLLVGAVAMF
jgi:hypothetical protein